jgi:hypothetical protein
MAQALGVRLLDDTGTEIGHGGGELLRLERIDTSGRDPRIARGRARHLEDAGTIARLDAPHQATDDAGGADLRVETAHSAVVLALHGIERELPLPPALEGNAYESDAERFASSLREAIAALEESGVARTALGDQVVDHYLNYARTEQALFDKAVTDWERIRLFERG